MESKKEIEKLMKEWGRNYREENLEEVKEWEVTQISWD